MDLYLASGNAHKLEEFKLLQSAHEHILRGRLRLFSARDVGGMPAVVEDTGTFIGNARKKALALLEKLPVGSWAMADDSGLCVDHLGGAPGVESAYFAGPQGDSRANLAKLVSEMKGVPFSHRYARFICVLYLAGPDGDFLQVEGRCEGRLLDDPAGGGGFGYDPLFVPEGYSQSFAELGEGIKNQLSHRGRAWSNLMRDLNPFLMDGRGYQV